MKQEFTPLEEDDEMIRERGPDIGPARWNLRRRENPDPPTDWFGEPITRKRNDQASLARS